MRIDIHHFYHYDARVLENLSQINQRLSSIEESLDTRLEEILNKMSQQEEQLQSAIADVKQTVAEGFTAIGDAVQKATQRVIQRLEQNETDLSDETDILRELQASVRSTVGEQVSKIQQIGATEDTGDGEAGQIEALPEEKIPPGGVYLGDESVEKTPVDEQPPTDESNDANPPAPDGEQAEDSFETDAQLPTNETAEPSPENESETSGN